MLVDGSLDNLLQGVSQQPNKDRKPGQCSVQLNAIADIVDGWKRRSPTEYIASLSNNTTCKWHFYDTGVEQYIVQLGNQTIRIWDLDGVEQTFAMKSNLTYLASTEPKTDIRLTTIGDYTVISNKLIPTAMNTNVAPNSDGIAQLYFTSGGENEQRYTINIGGVQVAEFLAPSITATAPPANSFSVKYAVQELRDQLVVNTAVTDDYSVLHSETSILLTRLVGTTAIDVQISDGHADDRTCWVIQGNVRKIENLPSISSPSMIAAIVGDGTNETDDYYMIFEVNEGLPNSFGSEGVWRETLKPGITYSFDEYTMPHVLVRLPDTTFYFGPLTGFTVATYELEAWDDRLTGNEITNPLPLFIGEGITSVGTFQERMYVLSNDVVRFSATNSYFDMFKKTGLKTLVSDPIESISADDKIADLKFGIQHNRNLVFFTEFSQFLIGGSKAIEPDTFSMPFTTGFKADLTAEPVSGGDVIFFPINYGAYAGVQEFFTNSAVDSNNAVAITEHVKRYLVGEITQLASNPALGILLVRTSGAPNSIFVYQYVWQDGVRVQSAWGEWTFDNPVEYMFWKDAVLYMCISSNTGFHIVSMGLTDETPTSMPFNIYTDLRIKATPNNKVVTLPYTDNTVDDVLVVQGADCAYPGLAVRVGSIIGTTLTLLDDVTGSVFIGVKYKTQYDPSLPKILDYKDRVISTDRLIITRFLIAYKETGHFNTVVQSPYYDDTGQEFTGRVVGGLDNLIGTQPILSGVFPASVRRKASQCTFSIQTDSYLPLTLTAIEWIGQYNKRGKRI